MENKFFRFWKEAALFMIGPSSNIAKILAYENKVYEHRASWSTRESERHYKFKF